MYRINELGEQYQALDFGAHRDQRVHATLWTDEFRGKRTKIKNLTLAITVFKNHLTLFQNQQSKISFSKSPTDSIFLIERDTFLTSIS